MRFAGFCGVEQNVAVVFYRWYILLMERHQNNWHSIMPSVRFSTQVAATPGDALGQPFTM